MSNKSVAIGAVVAGAGILAAVFLTSGSQPVAPAVPLVPRTSPPAAEPPVEPKGGRSESPPAESQAVSFPFRISLAFVITNPLEAMTVPRATVLPLTSSLTTE